MDKGNIDDFEPIFVIGLYKGNPAIKANHDLDLDLSPIRMAGFLTALVECIVDKVPEPLQVEFEQEALKLFRKLVKTRYERTNKLNIDPNYEG
jgi:hypothetical protein